MSTAARRDPGPGLADTFAAVAAGLTGPSISVRELLALIGEQSLLLACVFLSVPFLLPVAIPGTSVLFGLLLALIGAGVTLNRVPWLPERLLDRRLDCAAVARALRRGARLCRGVERLARPRLLVLTDGATLNRANGVMLVFAALLLMAPLPLVPFASTLPAIAIILLAAGMAERDGVVVLMGYLAMAVASAYVGLLLVAVFWAGSGLAGLVPRFLSL